jgi:tungstate transport system substrate-binding protein
VLVHAPEAEEEFVREGHGADRRYVMRNEFVIVGLPADPANLRDATTAADAFTRIAHTESEFISRGDDSGTHKRERAIWAAAGITPEGDWYLDAGQGMGEVLMIADERGSYTLTDRGTYLSMRGVLRLVVLFEGDPVLENPYHVIAVRGARNPEGARRFIDWITGAQAQTIIGAFGVEELGRPLFYPAAR